MTREGAADPMLRGPDPGPGKVTAGGLVAWDSTYSHQNPSGTTWNLGCAFAKYGIEAALTANDHDLPAKR